MASFGEDRSYEGGRSSLPDLVGTWTMAENYQKKELLALMSVGANRRALFIYPQCSAHLTLITQSASTAMLLLLNGRVSVMGRSSASSALAFIGVSVSLPDAGAYALPFLADW